MLQVCQIKWKEDESIMLGDSFKKLYLDKKIGEL